MALQLSFWACSRLLLWWSSSVSGPFQSWTVAGPESFPSATRVGVFGLGSWSLRWWWFYGSRRLQSSWIAFASARQMSIWKGMRLWVWPDSWRTPMRCWSFGIQPGRRDCGACSNSPPSCKSRKATRKSCVSGHGWWFWATGCQQQFP